MSENSYLGRKPLGLPCLYEPKLTSHNDRPWYGLCKPGKMYCGSYLVLQSEEVEEALCTDDIEFGL